MIGTKIAWMSALARISASRFGRIAARRAVKRWPSSIKMVNLFPYIVSTVDFYGGRLFVGLDVWSTIFFEYYYPATIIHDSMRLLCCVTRSIRFLLPQLRCQHVQHNGHLRQRNLKSHHKGMPSHLSSHRRVKSSRSFNYPLLPHRFTGNLQLQFKLLQPKLRRAGTTAGRRSLRHFGSTHDPILNTDMLGKS